MRSGRCWSRCCLSGRSRVARRNGPDGSSSTGSAGECGPGLRGEMCCRPMGHGRRSTGCFAAGNGPGSGGSHPGPVASPCRCYGIDHLGCQRRLDHCPGPPARRRCAEKGDAQKEPPGGAGEPEPADHALGRSRGGLTTKLHLATEQGQKPLSLVITAGQRGDSPQFRWCGAASASPA